jgi:hypothetical protein
MTPCCHASLSQVPGDLPSFISSRVQVVLLRLRSVQSSGEQRISWGEKKSPKISVRMYPASRDNSQNNGKYSNEMSSCKQKGNTKIVFLSEEAFCALIRNILKTVVTTDTGLMKIHEQFKEILCMTLKSESGVQCVVLEETIVFDREVC